MGLKAKVIKGAKWNIVSVGVNSLVQILRIVVLSRLLDVSDFGLMAIALAIVSFTEIFSDLGFTVPIIHKQNITQNQYSSVFWINVILSVLIMIVLNALAPWIAEYYGEPILQDIVCVLSVIVVVNAFGKIFQTIKIKELDFKFISIVSILSAVLGFLVIFVLAVMDYGIWSLVIGTLAQTIIRQSFYFIYGLKFSVIHFHLNLSEIKEFLSIGSYQVGAQILDFIANKIDVFILGRLIGMDSLGIYNLAKDFILRIYSLFVTLSRSVASAALAKVQDDIERLITFYSKYAFLYALIAVPVFCLVFIYAQEISIIIYGNDKAGVLTFPLCVLSLFGLFNALCAPTASLMIALGRTNYSLQWTLVCAVVNIISVGVAGFWGLHVVLYSQVFSAALLYLLNWKYIINKLIHITLKEYVRIQYIPLVVAVPLMVLFSILHANFSYSIGIILVSVVLFMIGYVILIICFNSYIRNCVKQLKKNLYV